MRKILLTLLGIIMIVSCSTDEPENSINSTASERSVIQKSLSIEDRVIKDLEDQFSSLQVGSEFESVEVDPTDETNVYGTIRLKVLCKKWNIYTVPPSFSGYGIDAGGQHYYFYSHVSWKIDLSDPNKSSYTITIYARKVSAPDC